jgi:hypothetical protein
MPASPFNTLSRFTPPGQPEALFYSLPALAAAEIGNIARLPVSLRIVLEALLRHCDGQRVSERNIRELAAWQPRAHAQRGDSLCRRARRAAGFHRRAAALRSGGDAPCGAGTRARSAAHRAAGAGRPGRRSFGAGRLLRHAAGAAAEHEPRVRAQPRALSVHEVGHAGFQHLPRRAAGRRHRPSGQSRTSVPRRASAGKRRRQRCVSRTRWSVPTRTRR